MRDSVCNELLVTSIYVGIDRHDTSIHNADLFQHPSEYVSIRQHTTAHDSIRQHTACGAGEEQGGDGASCNDALSMLRSFAKSEPASESLHAKRALIKPE